MRKIAAAMLALSLCACGASLPSESTVQHVAEVSVDTAVELCLLAHGVNVNVNAADLPKMMAVKDKIDGACLPALQVMSSAAEGDLPALVEKLRSELRGLLQ